LSGSDVENVGYVIPTPVVHHFLNDYLTNGKFTGFPGLGIQWQRMESEALRKAHHMKQKQKGKGGRGAIGAAAQSLMVWWQDAFSLRVGEGMPPFAPPPCSTLWFVSS
jgi:hypothetical protein